ncbi:hypothetical protein Tco_0415431 [Tanacetum coccineum]
MPKFNLSAGESPGSHRGKTSANSRTTDMIFLILGLSKMLFHDKARKPWHHEKSRLANVTKIAVLGIAVNGSSIEKPTNPMPRITSTSALWIRK